MSDEISKYIEVEKDLSKYQLNILLKNKNPSLAQKRLIEIEREFLQIPFNDMSFEDVADVAAAISIYKTSRLQFYKTYNIKTSEQKYNVLLEIINKKINFIRNLSQDQMFLKTQEINLVQNSSFYYELLNRESIKNSSTIALEKKKLDLLSLEQLNELEPIILSKKRARLQAIYYSIGKYLRVMIDKVNIDKNKSYTELLEINQYIDNIINEIKNHTFEYYNEGLNILHLKLKDTMGKNPSILKIHYLQNVLSIDNVSPTIFDSNYPKDGLILANLTKDSNINDIINKNKSFGILLPIPHIGNEKLSLLYKEIYIDNRNLSHIFLDYFVNVKAIKSNKESYYKGIVIHPLSFLKEQYYDDYKFLIDKLSKNNNKYLHIDKKSLAFASQTRSEDECFEELSSFINIRISEIKNDYNNIIVSHDY